MTRTLKQHYAPHIERIENLMLAELAYWQWDAVPRLQELVRAQLGRKGKRLRPLLTLIFADLFGGPLERTYAAAAAIEVYHTATLIYDDIQDNSEFRRGLPCAHVTTSTSTAMNLAGTIRSLMYHILHRAVELTPEERLEIHRRIDEAATRVSCGQSIDIGWHEGWYLDYQHYPYDQMVAWKSAALFGCAAGAGAFIAGASMEEVRQAEDTGTDLGILFQMVDDYLDIYGDPQIMRRPLFNDFREGKLAYPVIILLDKLAASSNNDTLLRVLESLARRDAQRTDWQWMVQLMDEFDVRGDLRRRFDQRARQFKSQVASLGSNIEARRYAWSFVDLLLAHA
jgi:geranylgeranyl pyrophosphate synthase